MANARQPVEILLVEDDPENVDWTIEALKDGRLNPHVHVAEDGVEAMAFLRREGAYAWYPTYITESREDRNEVPIPSSSSFQTPQACARGPGPGCARRPVSDAKQIRPTNEPIGGNRRHASCAGCVGRYASRSRVPTSSAR